MDILTFQDALETAKKIHPKPHLLLGNGFSIACRNNIFRYERLFKQADFSSLSDAPKEAFKSFNTMDFERIIKVLRDTALIAPLYDISPDVAQAMKRDADGLKEILVRTIAASHPERPSDIRDEEYASCLDFRRHFATVYTLNYDLLLYWTHMHQDEAATIQCDDGFRTSADDVENDCESDYVVWEPGHHRQNLWFLHGALHIFDAGTEIQKYTWKRTGVRLIEQIRQALNKDYFPLFVSEGTSEEKLERIRHSDYLAKGYRSFQEIKNCLFIYGHSFAENDEHYLRLIEKGKLSHLFVGLFGGLGLPENQRIISRANAMPNARRNGKSLTVQFYDSESAHVWS